MKELLNTTRLQEQNIKAKDGSINKQKTSLEKLKNELKEKIADITEKSEVIEKLQSDLRTREVMCCMRFDIRYNIERGNNYSHHILIHLTVLHNFREAFVASRNL